MWMEIAWACLAEALLLVLLTLNSQVPYYQLQCQILYPPSQNMEGPKIHVFSSDVLWCHFYMLVIF
jgi:hypothetical protein